MMDREDAKKVLQNLQTRPFICMEHKIELDDDYVILKKEEYEKLKGENT